MACGALPARLCKACVLLWCRPEFAWWKLVLLARKLLLSLIVVLLNSNVETQVWP